MKYHPLFSKVELGLPTFTDLQSFKKKVRPSSKASTATSAAPCVDIRISSNLKMQLMREKAVEIKLKT